jgi:hypothetical protein
MDFPHGHHSRLQNFPTPFPSYLRTLKTSSKERITPRWTCSPRTWRTCKPYPLPHIGPPSSYAELRDLNRYLALAGFSTSNPSRFLTLILTSVTPSVLVLHDYFLTLPAEVDRFWSPLQIRQWGTFIFIANRYVGLLGHIPILYSYFFVPSPDLLVGQQDSKCYPLHKYHQILAVVVQTIVGGTRLTFLP